MIVFPNAKLNLGLNVVEKRADGFHNIETVFYPVHILDCLEVITDTNALQGIDFVSSGFEIKGNIKENLCIRAYHLLQQDFKQIPAIKMQLHKAIPMGAGLGGGSADGAFTLKLLNEKYNLQLTQERLIEYALQLGSDCPFFIINKPCFAKGRGEILQPISLDFNAYKLVLINPQMHISTAWAFANIKPAIPKKSILQIIQQPVETWKLELMNDFESPVCMHYPAIASIISSLYSSGAAYAALTGTGSTVFALFKKETEVPLIFPENYYIKWLNE